MKPFIQITRHLYEEPYTLNLVIIASNGTAMGSLEFYLNSDDLEEIGRSFENFPDHQRSNYLFERGSERIEDRHGWYFRMRAYKLTVLKNECGIQLRFNDNERQRDGSPVSDGQLSDFNIRTSTNHIHKIGALLQEFSTLKHQRLLWTPEESFLDNAVQEPPKNHGDVISAAFSCLP